MIQKIHLEQFRNFNKKTFSFSDNITVILGPNAVGKSNILEAVYLLATGKSYKARTEEEMVSYNSDIARIKGIVNSSWHIGEKGLENLNTNTHLLSTKLEALLTRGEIKHEGGEIQKTPRKRLLVNGVPRRLIDFAGNLKVVLFGPWDLDLVTESPSIRRRFLDSVLCQVDREYRRALLIYEKGLRHRNKLLLRIRDEGLSRAQLLYWDSLLIKNGDFISRKREELINFCNAQNTIGDTKNVLRISSHEFPIIHLEYDKSAISEGRLEQYKNEEVAAGITLVGPHRDDFVFKIKNQKSKIKISNQNFENVKKERNLATYGSRGEQRMGVLWLKLAELAYIEQETSEKPVLLLDDIFSELDHEHRDVVFDIAKNQQTIITTADPHYVEKVKGAEIVEL